MPLVKKEEPTPLTIDMNQDIVTTLVAPTKDLIQSLLMSDADLVIVNDDHRAVLVDTLHSLQKAEKDIEAKKKFIFKPWDQLKKNIQKTFFDEPEETIKVLTKKVKYAILTYDNDKDAKRLVLKKEAETRKVTLLDAPRSQGTAAVVYGNGTGVSKSISWKAQVTSKADVPEEYKDVVLSRVNKNAVGHNKADAPPAPIPGITWVKEENIIGNASQLKKS